MKEDADRTDGLAHLLGIEVLSVNVGEVRSAMQVQKFLTAPDGHLHAASALALATESAGVGCLSTLPAGARGFATIETKSNHLFSPHTGWIDCLAKVVHSGRTTQVWDATLAHRETGKSVALFRCTQMILY